MIVHSASYMSNSALIAWYSEHEAQISEQMSAAMDASSSRADLIKDLAEIKKDLEDCKASGHFGDHAAEIRALLTKYQNSPYAAELRQTLGPIADALESSEADWDAATGAPAAAGSVMTSSYYDDPSADAKQDDGAATPPAKPARNASADQIYDETISHCDGWITQVDGLRDSLNKQDALELLNIQELKASADQCAQLASTLMAGANQTQNLIITNIK